ncbi:hypothetical protein GTP38_23255 [Duganella sp. FT94W]|uniref:Uncharacterized protein n=1 Tax=Duganella lactea TaxID=2692173 RepID=A0ABW9VCS6_9BURK|nr:hypothetical protein [Duganella lactea]MYM37248.1 hypothetical protein [Duganella lactea]
MVAIAVVDSVLEVDGVVMVEVAKPFTPCVRAGRPVMGASPAQREFAARMENWRRVVNGPGGGGASAAVCAAWAKWYVALRTSEAPPHVDLLDEKLGPVQPMVSPDILDAWLIEEAWRKLGDFNDRMAVKCRYVFGFDEARTRTKLRGIRGPHVRLVIARAENNLQTILKKLDDRNTIRSTTCPPVCSVPTVDTTLPDWRRSRVSKA